MLAFHFKRSGEHAALGIYDGTKTVYTNEQIKEAVLKLNKYLWLAYDSFEMRHELNEYLQANTYVQALDLREAYSFEKFSALKGFEIEKPLPVFKQHSEESLKAEVSRSLDKQVAIMATKKDELSAKFRFLKIKKLPLKLAANSQKLSRALFEGSNSTFAKPFDIKSHKYSAEIESLLTDSTPKLLNIAGKQVQASFSGLRWAEPMHAMGELVYFDISSMYPALMVNYGLFPDYIDASKFSELYYERLRTGEPYLKEILNKTWGHLGLSEDTKDLAIKVVKYAQCLLICMIEIIERLNLNIIQFNTDAIIFEDKSGAGRDALAQFCDRYNFSYKVKYFHQAFQRNVSDYVLLNYVEIHRRGNLLGQAPFAVSEAALMNLAYGTPVAETVRAQTRLCDFCFVEQGYSSGSPIRRLYAATCGKLAEDIEEADIRVRPRKSYFDRYQVREAHDDIRLKPAPSDIDYSFYETKAMQLIRRFKDA